MGRVELGQRPGACLRRHGQRSHRRLRRLRASERGRPGRVQPGSRHQRALPGLGRICMEQRVRAVHTGGRRGVSEMDHAGGGSQQRPDRHGRRGRWSRCVAGHLDRGRVRRCDGRDHVRQRHQPSGRGRRVRGHLRSGAGLLWGGREHAALSDMDVRIGLVGTVERSGRRRNRQHGDALSGAGHRRRHVRSSG